MHVCDFVLDVDDVETILFDILNQFIPNGISLPGQTFEETHSYFSDVRYVFVFPFHFDLKFL